jgi:uncharacterized protein YbaR (Trm112 family)
VTLDAELLEILVCPNDRGDVDYLEDEQVIVCRTCGYRYPVRDGIPVMLIDEAGKPGGAKGTEPGAGSGGKPRVEPQGNPQGNPRSDKG